MRVLEIHAHEGHDGVMVATVHGADVLQQSAFLVEGSGEDDAA